MIKLTFIFLWYSILKGRIKELFSLITSRVFANFIKGEMQMAKKGDYFGLSYIVSLILAIIPVTSWVCGFVTRFLEGKIVAGLIRLIFGFTIVWILDLILMIVNKHILRLIPV
mgnify:CR=1 FL=1